MRLSLITRKVSVLVVLLIAANALTGSRAFSQWRAFRDSWRWSHFTTETNLPSDRIHSITETPAGSIWVGTEKGLARFNDFSWELVDLSDSLRNEAIRQIEPLGNDSVLVIANGELFAGNRNGFTKIIPSSDPVGYIQAVISAGPDRIFALGASRLHLYEDGHVRPFGTPATPVGTGGRNLWHSSSGVFWLNTVNGLYHWSGTVWTRILPQSPEICVISSLVEDSQGNVLAALESPAHLSGIWHWRRGAPARRNPSERLEFRQSMDVAPNGDVVAAYASGDVRFWRGGRWSAIDPAPPAFTSTRVIAFRKNGDLWLGTDRGLYLFRTYSKRWEYWKHPYVDARNAIHEIVRGHDGTIWLGTFNGLEIHRPGGRIEYIENILGTTLGTVTGIAEDSGHNIWISSGASFEGTFRWNGKNWRHYGAADGLRAERVHKIKTDRRGRLWFLGIGRRYQDPYPQPGAFVLESGEFTHWPAKDSIRDGLISGRVYCFLEGLDGSFYFGTLKGLSRWKDGTWRHWTERNGLRGMNERIYALVMDSTGTIWFTNQTTGLGRLEKNDSVSYFTTRSGLVNDEVWDIKVDPEGMLWISTKSGLSCYNHGVWSNFSLRSGLNTPELLDILPLEERVYIGTRGSGVNILNRREDSEGPAIEFAKHMPEASIGLVRWKVFPYWGELDPKEVESRYRIDGGDWSAWSYARELYRSDLGPGNHLVEVQAKGIFGDLTDPPANSLIHVEPYMHMRPEFYIPIGLMAVGLAFLGRVYYRKRAKYRESLRQSDERFRLIASSTSDKIFDYNFATNVTWSNDEANLIPSGTGTGIEESVHALLERVHPSDKERVRHNFEAIVAERKPEWQDEYRFTVEDGSYVHVLHRVLVLYTPEGRPYRLIGSAMDISDRKEAEELTRTVSQRIIQAQEGERRRVSRELHDSVNQILASVKFRIESLEEQIPKKSAQIKREARKTKLLLEKVMMEIRRISQDLRPAELDDLGLASAVRSLAEDFTERTGITAIVEGTWPVRDLPSEISVTLYRIIQESLTNVEKHAEASRVELACAIHDDQIVCTITDNGRGIQPENLQRPRPSEGGLGLVDMQERLSFVKGRLEVKPVGWEGTRVTVRIPLSGNKPSQAG